MVTGSAILRGAGGRVLAPLVVFALALRLLDAPPTSLAALGEFVGRAWVGVLVRPALVALGLAVTLYGARPRVAPGALASGRRWALALGAVLAAQLVGSFLVQAAGPAVGVPVDLATGAAAALVAFTRRPAGAARAAT